jgi:acyl dehydratase
MGDGGWVRQIRVENREPFLYGDTIWFKGEVTDKYKIKVAGVMYRAVNVQINGVNQRGEVATTGDATVYLPSRGFDVILPIRC